MIRLKSILGHIRPMSTESSFKYFPKKVNFANSDKTLQLNHTCLRIKDPKVTIAFYEEKFGMKLLEHKKFPEMNFDLYFLSFPKTGLVKNAEGDTDVFRETGILELTHNYGTESDIEFKVNNGNEEPHRGFGHICFSFSNLEAECQRLEDNGVAFKKKLTDGRQKNIAFALDPDGYWIELIGYEEAATKSTEPRFNHTMIRVKDHVKSLEFYQNVLGMKLIDVSEHANAKFTLYFLGYENYQEGVARGFREGLLELTHNWGTENEDGFAYHNGNTQPQGYGHICISTENAAKLCEEIEAAYPNLQWAPKFNHGKMKNLAFIKDPDNYSIEIVPHGLCV